MDGSEWNYSDWMPGHPNIHTDDQACVEMFKIGKTSTSNQVAYDIKITKLCPYHLLQMRAGGLPVTVN